MITRKQLGYLAKHSGAILPSLAVFGGTAGSLAGDYTRRKYARAHKAEPQWNKNLRYNSFLVGATGGLVLTSRGLFDHARRMARLGR